MRDLERLTFWPLLDNEIENNDIRNIWMDALSYSDPDYVEIMTDTFSQHEWSYSQLISFKYI